MADECDLGNIEFGWRGDHPLLPVLDHHGVMVRGVYIKENVTGLLDSGSASLIWDHGGSAIADGDVVMHSSDYCREGRERGAK